MSKRKSNPATDLSVVVTKARPARAGKKAHTAHVATDKTVLEPRLTRLQLLAKEKAARLAAKGVSLELDTYLRAQQEIARGQPGLQFMLDDAIYAKTKEGFLRAQQSIREYADEVTKVADHVATEFQKLVAVQPVTSEVKEKKKEEKVSESESSSSEEEEERMAEEAVTDSIAADEKQAAINAAAPSSAPPTVTPSM